MGHRETVSRRSFVQGAGAAGAAIACAHVGAALASEAATGGAGGLPAWVHVQGPVAEADIAETVSADVVVIGCGPAGYYTAASCAENGLSVALVAKGETFSAFGGTHFAFNSSYQQATGHTIDDVEHAVGDFLGMQGHKVNERIVRTWAARSGEAMDWLAGKLEPYGLHPTLCAYDDTPLTGVYPGGHTFYGGPNTPVDVSDNDPYTGDLGLGYVPQVDVAGAMMQVLDELGVARYMQHTCLYLEREGDGDVTGVVAQDAEGTYRRFEGARAVVICAGSYGANPEMVAAFCPTLATPTEGEIVSFDPNDGSLMQQAVAVGASMQRLQDHAPMLFCGDAHPVWELVVNKQGRRYMTEGLGTSYTSCSTIMQTGSKAYSVWCDAYADQIKPVKSDIENGADITPEMLRAKWDGLVEQGVFAKSDSLDEIAEFLGVPADALGETVETYNAAAEAGEDAEFHKDPSLLFKVEPPFYAGPMGVACLCVGGGLHVNEASQVLGTDDEPVGDLYAVGLSAGDFWANTYSTRFPGNCLGHSLTFGYLLGRQLAGVE